jgi:hypothetical protein
VVGVAVVEDDVAVVEAGAAGSRKIATKKTMN